MKIKITRNAGFCFGVNRAVIKIVEKLSKLKKISIYGKLIHNPQINKLLNKKGLSTIDNLENINNKNIALRTHGVLYSEFKKIKKNAAEYLNLVCPRVAHIQGLVKKYSNNNYYILILGSKDHPEVKSIASFTNGKYFIISSIKNLEQIPDADKYLLVSQTTSSLELFEEIKCKLINKNFNIKIINTICEATHINQNELKNELVNGYNKVIVIGGKDSSNTKKLVDIARKKKYETLHIETADEITKKTFNKKDKILITAGASTPDYLILNVLYKLKKINSLITNKIYFYINTISTLIKKSYILTSFSFIFVFNSFQRVVPIKNSRYDYISIFAFLTVLIFQISSLLNQYISDQIYDDDLLIILKKFFKIIKISIYTIIILNSVLIYNIMYSPIFYPYLIINIFSAIYIIYILNTNEKKFLFNQDMTIFMVMILLFTSTIISNKLLEIKYISYMLFFLLYYFLFFILKSKLNYQSEIIHLISNFLFSKNLKKFFSILLFINIILLFSFSILINNHYIIYIVNLVLFYIIFRMVQKKDLNYYNKILNLLNGNLTLSVIFSLYITWNIK